MQHFGKAALRATKNYTKGYSDTQAKVRAATSNDPWGPSGTQMNDIAQMTYNGGDFIEIMEMLDKRLNDKGKNWRHVYKSLMVLDYCLHHGSLNVVIYFRDNIYVVKTLKEFQYVDEDGKDQGANVRQKAKNITNILQDESRLLPPYDRRAGAHMRDRMIRGTSDDPGEPEDENRSRRLDSASTGNPPMNGLAGKRLLHDTSIQVIQNEIILQHLTTEVPNNAQRSAKSSESSTSNSSSSLPNELLYSSLPPSYSEAVGNGAISDDTEDDSDSDSNNMAPGEVEDLRRQMLKQHEKRQVVTCDCFEGERFSVTIIIIISTAIVAILAVFLGISRRNAQAFQDNQFGLLELAPGLNPAVDIVAIHGLDGHRLHSWTAKNDVCWLRDLLGFRVSEARILTYGYDANTRGQDQLSSQSLYSHALSLISNLALERQATETEERPIIFVAHSLGGIVLKNALVHAHLATKTNLFTHKAVALSTYGIIFLGTPHQGAQSAEFASILLNIQAITRPVNDALLKHLSRNSEALEQQLSQFVSISEDFVIKFGFETYPTHLGGGFRDLIVSRASAVVPGTVDAEAISINKNHVDMSKFPSAEDEDFKTISKHLSIMAKAAPHKIAKNWEHHRHP